MDATYKNELRELNELNWQRTRDYIDGRFAQFDGKYTGEFAKLKADMHKWLFVYWLGTIIPPAGLIVSLSDAFRR